MSIYKSKGNVQNFENYKGIKLMRNFGRGKLSKGYRESKASENQFGFIFGRLTMEAIYLLRCLMERSRDNKKIYIWECIDLEKTYYKILKEVLQWLLENKKV